MTPSSALSDLREWISFADPAEDRTWVFDASFMRSSFRCIFGEGCMGVLDADATDMAQGCCSYGAHFVDDDDVANVVAHFVRLEPRHMQFHAEAVKAGFLDREQREPDPGENSGVDTSEPATVTRLVDDACIFLNRVGSEQGAGCALHVAAVEAGERPLDWKPNVCWQVPIRLEHSTDDQGHVTSRLRDWKQRDWGVGPEDFHWWCTESVGTERSAYVGNEPVYVSSRDDIVELIGQKVYDLLVEALESRPAPEPPLLPVPRAVKLTTKRLA